MRKTSHLSLSRVYAGHSQRAAWGIAPHTTHKQRRTTFYIFYTRECEYTPALHSLLLLLAGDIEQNPGPITYPCPVCTRNWRPKRGALQCSSCLQWLCLNKKCSGLTNTKQYTPGWQCRCCQSAHNTDTNNNVPCSPIQIPVSPAARRALLPTPPFPPSPFRPPLSAASSSPPAIRRRLRGPSTPISISPSPSLPTTQVLDATLPSPPPPPPSPPGSPGRGGGGHADPPPFSCSRPPDAINCG